MRRAALWGFVCMGTGFLMLFLNAYSEIFGGNVAARITVYSVLCVLVFLSAILHMEGYVYLANVHKLRYLRVATWVQIFCYAAIVVLIMFGVAIQELGIGNVDDVNVFVGVMAVTIFAAQLAVFYGLAKLYQKLGMLAIAAMFANLWIAFVSFGWPTLLVLVPSAFLLLKASRQSGEAH